MAAKDSDKNQWTDPKDYGLPFVEITPLRAKSNPSKTEIIPIASVEAEIPVEVIEVDEEKAEIPPVVEVDLQPSPIIEKVSEKVEIPAQHKPKIKQKEEKKSTNWIWPVLLIALIIIAVIIWQLLSQSNPSELDSQSEKSEIVEAEIVPESQEIASESTTTDQNQTAVNQDSIANSSNSNPNISKPAETGTTIANIASGNLIRIESKAERPQYFIIVGSLPNERLAIEEASQYFSKTPEMYLISPEEGSRNYRLALSKFGSFRLAAEELEQIKSQYTEELWILKY